MVALDGVRTLSVGDLVADQTDDLPSDWSDQLDSWQRPVGTDLYAILYTSGTTGQPRGVMQIHGTYISAWAAILNNRAFRAVMKFFMPKDGRVISVMPMSHTMGFTEYLTSLIMGSVLVFPLPEVHGDSSTRCGVISRHRSVWRHGSWSCSGRSCAGISR